MADRKNMDLNTDVLIGGAGKSKFILLAKCLLAVALAAAPGCSQGKPDQIELLGEWLCRGVTTKLDGRADETKTYAGRELVTTFSAGGTFADVDNGVPGETISTSGSYEITNEHRLTEKILEASGSKFAAMLKGRTAVMDFKVVPPDQLTIVIPLADKDGKKIGTTESTFVRAPK